MTPAEILDYATKALILTLVISLPPIIAATVTGLLVSLAQALTQVQEQTVSFGFKLVALMFTVYLTARWMGVEIYNYTIHILDRIPGIGV